jgi:Mg-chelatase subunit ChlD
MPGPLTLIYPQALALGLVLLWLYVRRLRNRNLWRAVLLVLALLLLGYPMLRQPRRALDLLVVLDRSRSIAESGRAKQDELLKLVPRQLKPGDRLGVITFNTRPYLESLSDTGTPPAALAIPYSPEASDLAGALEFALAQAAPQRRTRVLLLSDGEYTGADPRPLARLAAQQGVALDYRDLPRLEAFNLAVSDAELPDQVEAGATFRVLFHVQASEATAGRYRVYRNGRIVGQEQGQGWHAFDFAQGENLIEFRDTLQVAAIHAYKLEVEAIPREREQVFADNTAEQFTRVLGERPLLLVNHTGAPDNLARVLAAGGVKTHAVAIGNYRLRLPQLTGYKAVILNNVPLTGLGLQQIEDLRDYVLQEGGGLLVTGGATSFASGGYYKSPLEPMLPVRLEDRQQSKRVSTAFSIAMDRSGSMAITTPSGKQKIELAANAAAECITLMSPADSISVIPVDSAAHVFVEQRPVDDPTPILSKVRSIESMGGGIFIYEALAAAGEQIIHAPQLNKHILLFADAADSEEPGDYKRLLEQFKQAGITVSVVGLGTEHDSDAELLKDVARRGGGSIYFTDNADQLVQFFTADTLTYTRNSFVKETAPVKVRPAARALAPEQAWADFKAGGYNLLFPAEQAEVALQTADSDQAPILAFWQRELGRVAALAFDTDGAFSATPNYAGITLAATHWVLGGEVEDAAGARVSVTGGQAHVRLELSAEERARLGPATLTVFTPERTTVTVPLHWEGYDRLAANVALESPGLHRAVIQYGGHTLRLGPLALPASPELLPRPGRGADFGRQTLAELAALSGGKRVQDLRDLTRGAVRATLSAPLVPPLVIAAILIMLLEIAEPRFGLLGWLGARLAPAWGRVWRRGRVRKAAAGTGESAGIDFGPIQPAREQRKRHAAAKAASDPAPPAAAAGSPQQTANATDENKPAPQPGKTDVPTPGLSYLGKSKSDAGRRMRK